PPTLGRHGLEAIRWARRTRPGTALRHVAVARRGTAGGGGRLEAIGRAVGPCARAVLGLVAVTGASPALGGRRCEAVGRTARRRPGAALGYVAVARRGATDGPGVPRRVLAGVARAVALIGRADVAVVGARRARRRLGVGGAARPAAGAHLRRVALARRAAADDEARLEHVGWTGAARPVARLVHVAGTRRRAAGRARVARRMLARVARPVALVGRARVASVRAGRARRLLRVGRAGGPLALPDALPISLACRAAADDGARLEHVGRTRAARPVARLVHVARARRRAAGRAGVARRMLAGVARTVAGVARAGVTVIGA